MSKETSSIGFALLLSLLIVAGVALASRSLFAPSAESTACRQHYTVACLLGENPSFAALQP